jgi:hypothetical protein
MALAVIGAGFGRTGTESMKLALEALGLGPCHHMSEVLADPAQLALWRRAGDGHLPDWNEAYSGYKSAVDWPTAFFWRELSEFYPDAKILLTVRDAGSWYDSFSKTILPLIVPGNNPDSLGVKLCNNVVFGGKPGDRSHAISVFEKNTADVKAAFSPDRLLVYELGSGWQPLCDFFAIPIPSVPYPSVNSTEHFNDRMKGR